MRKHLALTLLTVLFMSATGFAQDFMVKIANIQGGSTLQGYENAIKVQSYSHGIAACTATASGGSGGNNACKTAPATFSLMIDFDRSNIPLRTALLNGTVLPSADFYAFKTGGDGVIFTYYRIHMENVTIGYFQESGSEGSGQLPSISIGLNATKIAWQYIEQNSSGMAVPLGTTGWDYSANKAWTYTFPNL